MRNAQCATVANENEQGRVRMPDAAFLIRFGRLGDQPTAAAIAPTPSFCAIIISMSTQRVE